jgi:hypothetical protein
LRGEKPGTVPAGLAAGYSLWVSLKHAKLQGAKLPNILTRAAADKLWDEEGKEVRGK